MEAQDVYEKLVNILTKEVEIGGKQYLLSEEFDKFFVKGNKASGKRIRKVMQDLKVTAQEVRTVVQQKSKS